MPAENVTVPLLWWKLSDEAHMLEALQELREETGNGVRGSVGVFPIDAEGTEEWRLQFSRSGEDSAFVGRIDEFVTSIGASIEILSEAAFVERYPTITVPGEG